MEGVYTITRPEHINRDRTLWLADTEIYIYTQNYGKKFRRQKGLKYDTSWQCIDTPGCSGFYLSCPVCDQPCDFRWGTGRDSDVWGAWCDSHGLYRENKKK
jgi:hypothetical protein